MKIWHYTLHPYLESLLTKGVILPSKSYFIELEVVWLSINSKWEETITNNISHLLNKNGLFKLGIRPLRIEINPDLVKLQKWSDVIEHIDVSEESIKGLESLARQWGANPDQWYITYEAIPLENCISIEIWDDKKKWIVIGYKPQ